jgi:hypothetical protein
MGARDATLHCQRQMAWEGRTTRCEDIVTSGDSQGLAYPAEQRRPGCPVGFWLDWLRSLQSRYQYVKRYPTGNRCSLLYRQLICKPRLRLCTPHVCSGYSYRIVASGQRRGACSDRNYSRSASWAAITDKSSGRNRCQFASPRTIRSACTRDGSMYWVCPTRAASR